MKQSFHKFAHRVAALGEIAKWAVTPLASFYKCIVFFLCGWPKVFQRGGSIVALRAAILVSAWGLWVGLHPAAASPALILDDPDTVGRGRLEVIVAGAFLERGSTVSYEAPVVDVSLGLLDGFDFTFIGAPLHRVDDLETLPTQGNLGLGFKWRFYSREQLALSMHPAIDINVNDSSNLGVHFPFQIVYRNGRFLLGADMDYAVVTDAKNQWLAGTWAGWSLGKPLLLIGEVWALPAGEPDSVDLGFNLGLEWLTPLGLTILVSAGSDFAAFDTERIRWRGYFGLLWTFDLWGGPKPLIRPNRPRRLPEVEADPTRSNRLGLR
ncbi:MAG: hypothetical protein VX252_05240 [Myxococcota bacterium]|nr:hypothetical protein [Myxococcota bacterium]